MTRVLLVEDDASLGRTLAERLEREQRDVKWVRTVAEAKAEIARGRLGSRDRRREAAGRIGIRPGPSDSKRDDDARDVHDRAQLRREPARRLRDRRRRVPAEAVSPEGVHPPRAALCSRRQRPPDPLRVGGLVHRLRRDVGRVARAAARSFLQVRDSRVLKLLVDSAPRVVESIGDPRSRLGRGSVSDAARRGQRDRPAASGAGRRRTAQLIRSVRGVGYQWAGSEPRHERHLSSRACRRRARRFRRSG